MLTSTRKRLNVSPSYGVVKGISDEGGLFIFENASDFVFDESLKNLSYLQLAEKVLSFVFDDFGQDDIKKIVAEAYSAKNFDQPAGLKTFGDVSFLELWHGPTSAFKDMALTVLGNLMVKAKENIGEKGQTLVLTATSGDTGSATLSGFCGTGINAVVLYPYGGVSPVQEAQMQYYAKDGSRAIAIEDNFDFCQTLVKKVFTDKSIDLGDKKFSSANSINIGRLVPQVVYYLWTYLQLVRRGEIAFGEKVNFSVPTGNFGNILAGYIASKMGVPVNKFICASNRNDVLTDFFDSGVYDRKREFFKTISPSMDILVSSNLERLIYLASGGNCELVSNLMKDLETNGKYAISSDLKKKFDDFAAFRVDDRETEETIRGEFKKDGYLIDPHTAVALGAAIKFKKATGDKHKFIVVSTASAYKFPEAVADSLGIAKSDDIFKTVEIIENATKTQAPLGIKRLKSFTFSREVWKREEAERNLRRLAGDKNV